MTNKQLYIEEKYNGKLVRAYHIAEPKRFVLGSSKQADILLFGKNIAGVHACLDYQEGQWCLYDLGSESGTWVNGEAIVEKALQDKMQFVVGEYELHVRLLEKAPKLFKKSDEFKGECNSHQVVVERAEKVLQSFFLPRNQSFMFDFVSPVKELKAPTSSHWQVSEEGPYTIRQRLAYVPAPLAKPQMPWHEMLSGTNKYTIGGSVVFFLILILAMLLSGPKEAMQSLSENKYQRMIYDGHMMEKLKEQASQLKKERIQAMAGSTTTKASNPNTETKVTTKVIKSIRAAGLSDMIGRISKRAASNAAIARTLANLGVVSGSSGSAQGMATTGIESNGGSLGGKGGEAIVGGVGTKGVGGNRGIAGIAGYGNLQKGNVGSATVGMMEEESQVEGGLDKEVIAEYIRSQIGHIRYCYERQLSGSPDLHGKILVKFTIAATGDVASQNIGLSTLSSAMVEGCILRRVAQWKFPTPRGGTSVVVTYPFLFKSTN